MTMPLTADDVVVGILHELRKKDVGIRLTADRQQLHGAFAALRAEFPKMMEVFSFRQRETFQESCELDQAFSNLDATGLISRYNQTPRYYVLAEGVDVCFDAFSKGILENAGITEADLEKAGRAVNDAIGASAA